MSSAWGAHVNWSSSAMEQKINRHVWLRPLLMKTPISINEHGDITSFASVEEAEMSMEPIDVERGEYIVTDAAGQQLSLEVIIESKPLFWGLWEVQVKKVRIKDAR
jgi:hypothetical protein